MEISYALVGSVFGLIFGSAINAMVWRIKAGKSWVRGRSQCSECGHTLHAKDLVPVASWLMLGGKCRYCQKPIQDHPVVELITAFLFGLSAVLLAGGGTLELVKLTFWLVMLTLLIILAVYDARWMILPDKVMIPLIVVAGLYSVSMAVLTGAPEVFWGALKAAFLAGGGFYAMVYFSRGRAMGGGDIKLAFAMGLMLGIKGVAVALLLAFNTAALVAVVLLILKRRGRKDQLPFGPYLVSGTVVAFLYAQPMVDWYLLLSGVM